jgi:hypothetical protein
MPEAPPFPFNSAGTLYMCPPPITSIPRSTRYSSYQQFNRRNENGINNHPTNETTINSSSTPSKDSNDTSIVDSSTISIDDDNEELQPCSIADAPLTLVRKDDEREHNTSTESVASSQDDEERLSNGNAENNSVLN